MNRWHVTTVAGLAMVLVAFMALRTRTQSSGGSVTSTALRTPWGEPDLQGIWNSMVITPLERPAKYADREFLTDAEVAVLEKAAQASPVGQLRDVRAAPGTREDVEGAYNNIFSTGEGTRYVRSKRTSLIIDPPGGKLPPVTPEGQQLRAARRSNRFGIAGENGDIPIERPKALDGKPLPYTVDIGRPIDNPEDRNDLERCRGLTMPLVSCGGGCGISRIVQTPAYVTIYYELGRSGGAYRTIPIDSRPHLPPAIRLWLGDSVGHWEGDTLVVDTTNFTDLSAYQGVPDEKMHLIERFTRTSADDLKYQVTVDKPNLYTRPWTMEVSLLKEDGKKNQIYESACYEGNYALTSMLAGARAEEKAGASKRR
jgi:hypothetical protein